MRRFSRWRDDDDDEEDGGGSNPNPQPVGGVKIMSRRMSTRKRASTRRREPNEEGRVVMVRSVVKILPKDAEDAERYDVNVMGCDVVMWKPEKKNSGINL